ncbi:MAG: hypothetical protein AB7Q01_17440 [Gammaproteobacteria bacterium]
MAVAPHPQAEATYRVIPRDDGTFDAEIANPEAEPALVKGFATAADAEAWIAVQKTRVLASQARRHSFRDRRPAPLD